MKKIFFIIIAMLFNFYSAFAQDIRETKNHFSMGAESAFPLGLFGEAYSLGIGASGQANFAIGKQTYVTINAGYINYFLVKNYGGGSEGYFPLLNGIEQGFLRNFFASVQLGTTFRTHGLGNAFTYSPGIGIKFAKNFSALIKYIGQIKSAINSGAFGLRAAYTFGK